MCTTAPCVLNHNAKPETLTNSDATMGWLSLHQHVCQNQMLIVNHSLTHKHDRSHAILVLDSNNEVRTGPQQ